VACRWGPEIPRHPVEVIENGCSRSIGPERRPAPTSRTPGMWRALKPVKANESSAGVDGVSVAELPTCLEEHWPAIWAALLAGSCVPQPIGRVEIPKPDGGMRQSGIPTVLDRLIQQAIHQRQPALIRALPNGYLEEQVCHSLLERYLALASS